MSNNARRKTTTTRTKWLLKPLEHYDEPFAKEAGWRCCDHVYDMTARPDHVYDNKTSLCLK
jgi:hypothetical protein